MDHFQIANMPHPPSKVRQILEQLAAMSKAGEINFAFAFAYPDKKGHQWFEAHTGGAPDILKPFFAHDTNAAAEAQLKLAKQNSNQKVYFHFPPTLLQEDQKH